MQADIVKTIKCTAAQITQIENIQPNLQAAWNYSIYTFYTIHNSLQED